MIRRDSLFFRLFSAWSFSVCLFAVATISKAATDCVVRPINIYAGTDVLTSGGIWLTYANPNNNALTGSAYTSVTNVNTKNMLALVMTAVALNKNYQLRLQTTGANCFDGGQHSDWLGGWLLQ